MAEEHLILLSEQEGKYALGGKIQITAISQLQRYARPLFKKHPLQVVSLKNLEHADSALLALLIEWKQEYPTLQIQDIPIFLQELMNVYQLSFE